MPKLRFESPRLLYGIREPGTCHRDNIYGWDVFEEFEPESLELDLEGVGSYRVAMETKPENLQEARRLFEIGVQIAEDIEMLWLYVGASPLSGPQLGLSLVPLEPPKHWRSNFEHVRRELEGREFGLNFGSISFRSRYWAYPRELPLRQALLVRARYLNADNYTKALAELHFEARTASGQHAREVGFARALELVAELLPGHGDAQKAMSLPREVLDNLTRPLAWLYELSNRRFNTRHVVNRREKPELLPPMSGEEYAEFVQNADLVIRGVVAQRLGVPIIVTKAGAPGR